MRLLRIWPDDTRFSFMRFRRVSFPFSAAMSLLTVLLFLTVGHLFITPELLKHVGIEDWVRWPIYLVISTACLAGGL